jgi:hypothetical protein
VLQILQAAHVLAADPASTPSRGQAFAGTCARAVYGPPAASRRVISSRSMRSVAPSPGARRCGGQGAIFARWMKILDQVRFRRPCKYRGSTGDLQEIGFFAFSDQPSRGGPASRCDRNQSLVSCLTTGVAVQGQNIEALHPAVSPEDKQGALWDSSGSLGAIPTLSFMPLAQIGNTNKNKNCVMSPAHGLSGLRSPGVVRFCARKRSGTMRRATGILDVIAAQRLALTDGSYPVAGPL